MLLVQANGPAIWGGCDTRREHRVKSWYFSQKAVTVQGGGACPAVAQRKRGRVFLPSWHKFYCVLARSRYKFDRSREFITGYKFGGGHWRSVAVQIDSESENCQGTEDLIAGR